MAREEGGEGKDPQDSRFAGYPEQLLPPTSATIDALGKLIHKQAGKGEGVRIWNHTVIFEDGQRIDFDRGVTKTSHEKTDLYQIVLPDGARYYFLDDDELYKFIEQLKQSGEDQALVLEDYEEIAGSVEVDGDVRAMNDDDWRMLGTFISSALRLDKAKLESEDIAVVRSSVMKAMKHYLRDYGEYSARRIIAGEGEQLGLLIREDLNDKGEHRTELLVIHDVEVIGTDQVDRAAYTINMDGEARNVRIDRYRKTINQLITENERLMANLEEQADMGLDQPTQEDFQDAITLIKRFTGVE